MSEAKLHTGGCHCGKVRYEVTLDLAEPAITCNCSMCGRSGTMLRFVPAEKFKLLSGEDVLTHYRFNSKVIDHQFCSVCGIKSAASTTSSCKPCRPVTLTARAVEPRVSALTLRHGVDARQRVDGPFRDV